MECLKLRAECRDIKVRRGLRRRLMAHVTGAGPGLRWRLLVQISGAGGGRRGGLCPRADLLGILVRRALAGDAVAGPGDVFNASVCPTLESRQHDLTQTLGIPVEAKPLPRDVVQDATHDLRPGTPIRAAFADAEPDPPTSGALDADL